MKKCLHEVVTTQIHVCLRTGKEKGTGGEGPSEMQDTIAFLQLFKTETSSFSGDVFNVKKK